MYKPINYNVLSYFYNVLFKNIIFEFKNNIIEDRNEIGKCKIIISQDEYEKLYNYIKPVSKEEMVNKFLLDLQYLFIYQKISVNLSVELDNESVDVTCNINLYHCG